MAQADIAEIERAFADAQLIHDENTVAHAVHGMAEEIAREIQHANPLLVCVMNGGLLMTGWLASQFTFPLQIDYVHATRYRGTTRGGDLEWIARPRMSFEGRTVLLVDDIFDEGYTLAAIAAMCRDSGAHAVRSAVLARKLHDRAVPGFRPDFVGLTVPDRYVFGCGMDYKNYWRNLPAIYALRE